MTTQGQQPFLSIIIPAYNEAQRLPRSLQVISAFLNEIGWSDQTEVIVVDDGSEDQTIASVQPFKDHWPQLSIITMPHRGKGAAIKAGVKHATGDFVFFCDADLSMPIDEIVKFLPPQGPDCQIIIGSREAPGAKRYNEPVYRHLMGRIFNRLVQLLVLPGIQDTQCGFKCLQRGVAAALCAEQRLTGMSFDVELLALAKLHGFTIAEIPIDWYHERDSRVRPVQDSLNMLREVFAMRRRLKTLHHPPAESHTSRKALHTRQQGRGRRSRPSRAQRIAVCVAPERAAKARA
jgi:dolichyl-phosphate beta-glucosyltransferase